MLEGSEELVSKNFCPYCTTRIEIEKDNIMDHLIVLRNTKNHFHVHGPIADKRLMKQFIIMIARESGIELEDDKPTASGSDYKKI